MTTLKTTEVYILRWLNCMVYKLHLNEAIIITEKESITTLKKKQKNLP